ncbi:MAG: PDC sensor domain-containing protein [Candidatus Omnitrophica bacterium]|nr:PDC sensor domain-containing protein [Candidatus Omnitrophota bacterium]
MAKRVTPFILAALFLKFISFACADEDALIGIIKRIAKQEVLVWVKNPVIVNAVREANEEATGSLDEIIQLDKRWRAIEGIDEWINGFLDNPCANYLKEIQEKDKDLYPEIFVMDKQGCIVGETDKTTDYWQGDEDKFIKSFDEGKGTIFISESQFDESTQRFLIQLSVPIIDPYSKNTIGVITVGIDLDILAERLVY